MSSKPAGLKEAWIKPEREFSPSLISGLTNKLGERGLCALSEPMKREMKKNPRRSGFFHVRQHMVSNVPAAMDEVLSSIENCKED